MMQGQMCGIASKQVRPLIALYCFEDQVLNLRYL